MERRGGIRNIEKKSARVLEYATSSSMLNTAEQYLSGAPKLVRAIYFNKTPSNNWLVTWHQDKTVSVSEKFEKKGWSTWSVKDHMHHVQPPLFVLDEMVTFRVHLDASTLETGCLKVIPNSHTLGILGQENIDEFVDDAEVFLCSAPRGSALVMRPHILHSSSKATSPSHRRVLHLEYSSYSLPQGVTWASS